LSTPKTSKPKDARALRSRTALRQALLELIEGKSFEQISIRDITATAGVSYPVFFRQFSSKEELLDDIAAEEIRTLLTLPNQGVREFSMTMCRHVQAHRTLWRTLLTGGAASIMREEFIRAAKATVVTRGRINPWMPMDLTPAVTVSGMFEILAWWLKQPEDHPIEHVCRLLEVLVFEPVSRPQPLKP